MQINNAVEKWFRKPVSECSRSVALPPNGGNTWKKRGPLTYRGTRDLNCYSRGPRRDAPPLLSTSQHVEGRTTSFWTC